MKRVTGTLQIAATYIGTIVGAGFASGREIIQFFSQYGPAGTAGVIVSGILMTWIGTKMMLYARRIEAWSFNELITHLLGMRFGTLIETLLFFIIFGMTGVMLAGAGAVFQEQLGWSRHVGVALTILTGLFFLLKGVRGLLWMNTLVVPVMAGFMLLVFFIGSPGAGSGQLTPQADWVLSGVGYAAFNMLTALVVLVPLAQEIRDEKVLGAGCLLGGAGLTGLILLEHFLILGNTGVTLFDMPVAELIRPFGPALHLVFVAVIFGEILTTFTGNLFGLARQLESLFPAVFTPGRALLSLTAGALLIGQAGYSSLIATLYPLYAALCAAVFLYFGLVRLPEKTP